MASNNKLTIMCHQIRHNLNCPVSRVVTFQAIYILYETPDLSNSVRNEIRQPDRPSLKIVRTAKIGHLIISRMSKQ